MVADNTDANRGFRASALTVDLASIHADASFVTAQACVPAKCLFHATLNKIGDREMLQPPSSAP